MTIEERIAEVRKADEEAVLAGSAFLLGRFGEYLEAKYGRAIDKFTRAAAAAAATPADSPKIG